MGANSKIEWTSHTFNPWRGCKQVHAGCANCYAERMSKRNPSVLGVWGSQGTRVVAAKKTWFEPLKWDRMAKDGVCVECGGKGVVYTKDSYLTSGWHCRRCENCNETGRVEPYQSRVFCASLADVFEDWSGPMVDIDGRHLVHTVNGWESERTEQHESCSGVTMADVRKQLFDLIDATPNIDWLLVTKRPENIAKMWPGGFRKNVWLLASVSNQETADAMIPPLLECRHLAPVLGLSMEPLLGPVDLLSVGWPGTDMGDRHRVDVLRFGYWCKHPHVFDSPCAQIGERKGGFVNHSNMHDNYGKLSWIIVGGESGHGARPMHPQWVIDIRDQCQAAGVPFFFKQWGEWAPYYDVGAPFTEKEILGDKMAWVSPDGRWTTEQIRPSNFGDGTVLMSRVGKDAAGRLLDGRTWDELPKASVTNV